MKLMRKITALRARKGRGKRVNIFLDGKLAFSLEADVAAKEGLQVEQTLSAGEIDALTKSDHFQRCLNAATHYLGYRPRSEAELRRKLGQRGFDRDTQEAVITRLKNQGLVDDMAFAQFWRENRESFNPRSRQLTRLELRQKGLDDGIIGQVVATIDDNDSAYRVALNKARSLPHSDYQKLRRRLGEHLRRRGFSYGVINHTVERLWQGQTNSPR
ncbi:regulatory protein RecX [Chloroflexota bacterium]